ncbi:MAG: DUF192 domain-containing protein [Pseudomonadota bacterium]
MNPISYKIVARSHDVLFQSRFPWHLSGRCISLLAAGLLLLLGCSAGDDHFSPWMADGPLRNDGSLAFFRPDGSEIVSVLVEIAETHESISKGLMGRRSLDSKSGMLFLFRKAEFRAFWMRNTPLPLDIIFVGENSCVSNIARRTEPMSDRTYYSKGPVKFVVEVRAGFSEQYGITQGTCIRWQRRKE